MRTARHHRPQRLGPGPAVAAGVELWGGQPRRRPQPQRQRRLRRGHGAVHAAGQRRRHGGWAGAGSPRPRARPARCAVAAHRRQLGGGGGGGAGRGRRVRRPAVPAALHGTGHGGGAAGEGPAGPRERPGAHARGAQDFLRQRAHFPAVAADLGPRHVPGAVAAQVRRARHGAHAGPAPKGRGCLCAASFNANCLGIPLRPRHRAVEQLYLGAASGPTVFFFFLFITSPLLLPLLRLCAAAAP